MGMLTCIFAVQLRQTSQMYKSRLPGESAIARTTFKSTGIGCPWISFQNSSDSTMMFSFGFESRSWSNELPRTYQSLRVLTKRKVVRVIITVSAFCSSLVKSNVE